MRIFSAIFVVATITVFANPLLSCEANCKGPAAKKDKITPSKEAPEASPATPETSEEKAPKSTDAEAPKPKGGEGAESTDAKDPKPETQVKVKNEVSFGVPAEYQKDMGLKTEALKAGKDGFQIPTAAIQTIKGKEAVFFSLGKNQFAMRYLTFTKKTPTHAMASENLAEGETLVTAGADMLKAGLLRAMSSHHHGHSHGAGGHSH